MCVYVCGGGGDQTNHQNTVLSKFCVDFLRCSKINIFTSYKNIQLMNLCHNVELTITYIFC